MDVISENINSMQESILNDQFAQGKSLAGRFFNICAKFRGFDDPSFNQNENKSLLNDLLAFEKTICSFDLLYVLYGQIARMYLQTSDTEKCIMYGQAALELNNKSNDQEGVWAANMVLCDCALANDASVVAVEYFKKAKPDSQDEIAFFKQMPNNAEGKIRKLLARKRRPSSYAYFESDEKKLEESKVRFLMIMQGISRPTAKQWCARIKQ